jgi:peroxiredoxin
VQILGVSADNPWAQKTFADSLKLPYPLLSDAPELKTIRQYGILSAAKTYAYRSFFLVDRQGILRHQWLLGAAGDDTVFPSEQILKVVREVAGKP